MRPDANRTDDGKALSQQVASRIKLPSVWMKTQNAWMQSPRICGPHLQSPPVTRTRRTAAVPLSMFLAGPDRIRTWPIAWSGKSTAISSLTGLKGRQVNAVRRRASNCARFCLRRCKGSDRRSSHHSAQKCRRRIAAPPCLWECRPLKSDRPSTPSSTASPSRTKRAVAVAQRGL